VDAAELIARALVRDTIVRDAHLVDGGRLDDVVALFTEDGVLHANDLPPLVGRPAIRAFLLGTKARLASATARPWIRHHLTSILVDEIGPAEATARAYFLAVTERGWDHWGRYRDRLVPVEGRWLFRHRRVRTDGHVPDAWGG
jgi:hypothetical protein